MAAMLAHYLIAELYNNKYINYKGKDLNAFLIGTLAADSPRSQGKGEEVRARTHFGISANIDLIGDSPCDLTGKFLSFNSFIDKYGNRLEDPFLVGYLLHLYVDKKWFSELVMELYDKYAPEIKYGAKKATDLSFKEAFSWYMSKENLYHTFDVHDILFYPRLNIEHINDMVNYDVSKCPVDEIDKEDLKNTLNALVEKCDSLKDSFLSDSDNSLITLERMDIFFDSCAHEMHDFMTHYKN